MLGREGDMLGNPGQRAILTGMATILLLGALALLGWQLATPPVGATDDPDEPTPIPNVVLGQPSALEQMYEGALKRAIDRIPADKKVWIDSDTVVYLLAADPHDLDGAQIAVAQHLPSKVSLNYAAPGAAAFAENLADHPDGRAQADRMDDDTEVAKGVSTLLGGK